MVKQEWGLKRLCQGCGTRFYDLGKSPIICPKCSHAFDPEFFVRGRRSNKTSIATTTTPKATSESTTLFETLENEEEAGFQVEGETNEIEENDLMEDTSDLGGDDENVVESIGLRDEEAS